MPIPSYQMDFVRFHYNEIVENFFSMYCYQFNSFRWNEQGICHWPDGRAFSDSDYFNLEQAILETRYPID